MPGSHPPGASQGDHERAFSRLDAKRGECARGPVRNLRRRQASQDRMALAARTGERGQRDHYRSRSDATGSLHAAGDRPQDEELAPEGAPRVAICSQHRRQRQSPHGVRRSRPHLSLLVVSEACLESHRADSSACELRTQFRSDTQGDPSRSHATEAADRGARAGGGRAELGGDDRVKSPRARNAL